MLRQKKKKRWYDKVDEREGGGGEGWGDKGKRERVKEGIIEVDKGREVGMKTRVESK